MTVPVSIESNVTGLSIALESAVIGVLPGTPIWYGMEPNSYSNFGATFKTVARETINATRQRLQGTLTDEDAKGGFNQDFTQHNTTRFLQGFFFANAIEKPSTQPFNGTQIALTAVTATQFEAAAGLGIFSVGCLVSCRNFINAQNNGFAHITAVAAGALTTDKALIAETPPSTAYLEVCGVRGASGDIELTISGALVVLTSTVLNFTTLGLNVGEWIYIGGDAAANHFATAADTGYARISAIAANALSLNFTTFTPVADSGAGKLIDLYFGKVIMNATSPTSIVRQTYQLERTLGSDGTGTQAEYLVGAVANELTLSIPDAGKLSADLAYVGLSETWVTGAEGLAGGTRVGILGEAAINTTQNVYLSRLAVLNPATLDPTPLFAYCSNAKLTINNGAAPIKAIGVLGGFDISEGDFVVNGTITAYFQTVSAAESIAANASVEYQTIFASENAGFVFDMPLLTLGGGENKVTKDKPITVDLTQAAVKCPAGYTLMSCFFDYLPNAAMPA